MSGFDLMFVCSDFAPPFKVRSTLELPARLPDDAPSVCKSIMPLTTILEFISSSCTGSENVCSALL
jgi:hypothetical protein